MSTRHYSDPSNYYNYNGYNPYNYYNNYNSNSYDDRFGFIGPFILGGLAGGLAAPLFYGGYNTRPNNYYYYPPYYYGPY